MNHSGKLTYKVVPKLDYIRADGTCALYIQIFLNKKKKLIPVNRSVKPADFDRNKQRVKTSNPQAGDTNLIIEKMLADINTIEVGYRISNKALTMDLLLEEFENPTANLDFIAFWENEMKSQKDNLKASTYRQQMSVLAKLKKYKAHIYFHELTEDLVKKMRMHFLNKLKNRPTTVNSFMKTFKKILHLANKRGIVTPLHYSDISVGSFLGERTFLMPDEIVTLHKYWKSEFINPTHKLILSRFLFSCFTSLRISDNLALTNENFFGDFIAFVAVKTGKMHRIALSESAKIFLNENNVAEGNFTPEYINRELKFIAKAVGIRKTISFHVSRHTFATNYLLSGGNVVNLQKILGHYKIEETMIYVHIVESISDIQVRNMDEILKSN